MERIGFVVKYFPAGQRISGMTSLASLLVERLAAQFELHVFSRCAKRKTQGSSKQKDYILHRVPRPFWLRVGYHVKTAGVRSVVLMSGVNKVSLFYPVFKPIAVALGRDVPIHFYQGTNIDGPPGILARRLLAQFRNVVCAGPGTASMLEEYLNNRCNYLPPGVDLDGIRLTAAAPKGADLRVGFFNHFNKRKGFDLALEAFAACPFQDTEYVVAGRGPLEKKMRRYEKQKGIKFMGCLENPISEIKACDYMVLPFRTSVSVLGISQTVLECMAAGVPVIGSDKDAITSAICHEKEGLIFQRPEQLVECITRLHDDRDLRMHLSNHARKSSEKYQIDQVADKLSALIREDMA